MKIILRWTEVGVDIWNFWLFSLSQWLRELDWCSALHYCVHTLKYAHSEWRPFSKNGAVSRGSYIAARVFFIPNLYCLLQCVWSYIFFFFNLDAMNPKYRLLPYYWCTHNSWYTFKDLKCRYLSIWTLLNFTKSVSCYSR